MKAPTPEQYQKAGDVAAYAAKEDRKGGWDDHADVLAQAAEILHARAFVRAMEREVLTPAGRLRKQARP